MTKHDRIFANDNIIYFGAQRPPATKWSHFDPGLQNNYEIQVEMVHELEINAPPYIVLDSEFEHVREPNESSRSSGITLLDETSTRCINLRKASGACPYGSGQINELFVLSSLQLGIESLRGGGADGPGR